MSRICDHLLEPGERLILRARVHWWFNLRSFGMRNLFEPVLVTDRRILEKTGILAITTRSLALDQIETRDVRQSVWGRIFGFGDLEIHGSGGQMLEITDIRDPLGVARAIGRAAADRRARAETAEQTNTTGAVRLSTPSPIASRNEVRT